MNLGDGLMFELENGKPRLVLASYGEPKGSSKLGLYQLPHRNRTQQQKATFISKQHAKESERSQLEKSTGPLGESCAEQSIAQRRRKIKDRSNADRRHIMGMVRVRSESKTKTTDESSKVTEKTVKESLVCLTQDQLQQILNTIKTTGQNVQDDSKTHVENRRPEVDTKEGCVSNETLTSGNAETILDGGDHRQGNSPGKAELKKPIDSRPSGLFSTLGQREQDREALEVKRAQWKRELDEQMTLKNQQKANAEVLPQSEGPSAGPRSSEQPQVQEDRITTAATHTECSSSKVPQPDCSLRALPAAVRSAFVLGEATPLEDAFSKKKKEEQRRWLENLEQQREEARLRKKLEKRIQSQAEDHERWAMHFDSFQRGLHQPLLVPAPDGGRPDVGSSLSQHRSPSGALSTAWDTMSAFGGDSMGRASADTTQAFPLKSSYLRTMTALLDPAQIEERERKRLKQLEHQRAIEAQVEERRQQKEKEEAARQALEQEEERRLARERDLLQQQYLKDTQRQRQKEELQTRKTEELYLSVQRAQEEAHKDKHLQRIRELARKGHDVSNLLRSLECESSRDVSGQGSLSLTKSETTPERVQAPTSTRKDTAVQTEVNAPSPPKTEGVGNTNGDTKAQAVASQYQASSNIRGSKRESRLSEKNTGKENVCVAPKDTDPYEAYARTDRPHGEQQWRKPQWNTKRPNKAFVPASERYPATLQRHRQESRLRRQMELMTLVERNAFPSPPSSVLPAHLQRRAGSPHQKVENLQGTLSTTTVTQSRGRSPPVPAVRHRLLQVHKPAPPQTEESTVSEWPPSSDYIPYVRTDEVYHLDPLAPLSRPSTHEVQHGTHEDATSSRQHSPLVRRDPLLNPELLKSTERQQAILKGLSDLRQGLLQKQKELETSINPLLQGQSRNLSPAFQPM